MVVVDSSVWIEFFRGRDKDVVTALSALLDEDEVALAAPVRLEILSGARTRDVVKLRKLLSALPHWKPAENVWAMLESWIAKARLAGERFGAMDLLIAGIAAEHGASLWSKDGDFERMERLGFVAIHRP